MIVGHRGASRDAPENTVRAFQLAWEQGADAIEGDFQLTRDGRVVCIHDGNTKRVAGSNLVVRESTFDDLRKLDVGGNGEGVLAHTPIPTIGEVFATVPDQKAIYIEIKCGAEIISPLLAEIRSSGLEEQQVVFICFNADVLRELKATVPRYKAFWLCCFRTDESGRTHPALETVLSTLEEIGANGISSNIDIPEPFVEAIKGNGYQWHVWTVDDPKTARCMKAWGARSITTNRPGDIRRALDGQAPAVAVQEVPAEA